MENIHLDKSRPVDDLLLIADNRFTLRSKVRKNLDSIRRKGGDIKYLNWRIIYSAHARSVKWGVFIIYQANSLI